MNIKISQTTYNSSPQWFDYIPLAGAVIYHTRLTLNFHHIQNIHDASRKILELYLGNTALILGLISAYGGIENLVK
jgi:hypothetical protein